MKKRLEGRLCLLVTTLTRATFLSYLGSGPLSIKNYLCGILKVPARSRVCHRWLMMRKVSQTSSPALGTTGRGVGFAVFNQQGIYQTRGYRRCSRRSPATYRQAGNLEGLWKSMPTLYIYYSHADNAWCIAHIHYKRSRLCLDFKEGAK